MPIVKGLAVDELLKRGSIKDVDVARFRRALYEDHVISSEEAETLFAVNDGCPVQDAAWSGLFIEAITDFIVNRAPPEGYVTAENSDWLIGHIARDDIVESKTELELLVSVLDKARWSPESLCLFALGQVKRAVVKGHGPLRNGQALSPGRITPGEVDLVRRTLFAFAGSGSIAITRGEAEILFQIEESLQEDAPNAAWTSLFVKAVANMMMSSGGYKMPTREEALRREDWLDSRGDAAPGAVLAGVVKAALGSVWPTYREQSREERAIEQLERRRIEIITNEEITPIESEWLAQRLLKDGRLSANEAALVDYLKSESRHIGPALQALVGRMGAAA